MKSIAAITNISNHTVISLLEGSLRDAINSSVHSQVICKSLSSNLDLNKIILLKCLTVEISNHSKSLLFKLAIIVWTIKMKNLIVHKICCTY